MSFKKNQDKKKKKEKKRSIFGDNKLRVPRLRGTTLLAQSLHNPTSTQQEKDQIKENIRRIYIEHYVLNQMRINGQLMKIEELARWLDVPNQTIMLRMNREIGKVGKMLEGKEGAAFARALIFGGLNFALEAQGLIAQQVHILRSQQGTEYVPFLTSELNKALATMLTATKPITELLKVFTDGNPGIVINNLNQQANMANQANVTPDQVVNLIKSEGYLSMLEDESILNAKILALNEQKQLPEIRAQYQDLNSIGIKTPNRKLDGPEEPNHTEDTDSIIVK